MEAWRLQSHCGGPPPLSSYTPLFSAACVLNSGLVKQAAQHHPAPVCVCVLYLHLDSHLLMQVHTRTWIMHEPHACECVWHAGEINIAATSSFKGKDKAQTTERLVQAGARSL